MSRDCINSVPRQQDLLTQLVYLYEDPWTLTAHERHGAPTRALDVRIASPGQAH